jgi:hypothetical protein
MSVQKAIKEAQLQKVKLQSSEKTVPTYYLASPEEPGLLYDSTHKLAVFTSRNTPAVGPEGPPGEDKNSWFDTIIASCSDERTPIAAGALEKTTFRAPYPLKFNEPGSEGYIRASLTLAPQGGPFRLRVTANGVECTDVPIQIDAGSKTSVGSSQAVAMAISSVPDDAEFLVFVDQVGTSFAGSGLKVAITGIKTE